MGLALVAFVCSLAAAVGSPSPASAVPVQFCNYSVNYATLCPAPPSGDRHTYTTASADMSVCLIPHIRLYVAYTSSNASSHKYDFVGGTCALAPMFYGNTELLRPYGWHEATGWAGIFGTANY